MNTQQLAEKYPKIFSELRYGVETGDGWHHLIDNLCQLIQSYIDSSIDHYEYVVKHNKMIEAARSGDKTNIELLKEYWDVPPVVEQVVATQVKEKLGGLRFYIKGGNQYVDGAIALAELMSFTICEECGKPGKTGGKTWLKTLCPEHTTS